MHIMVHRVWFTLATLTFLVPAVIASIPITISLIALFVSLHDRRPHILLRARKGKWYKLKPTLGRQEVIFEGMIEAYNQSGRANAIRAYKFWGRRPNDSNWEQMDSEYYRSALQGEPEVRHNWTPVTLPPYSGEEVRVMALMRGPQPYEMDVRIEIEDLFGKHYHLDVKAIS